MTAGYSLTPLSKKLGIKPGFNIFVKNPPENYLELITPTSNDVKFLKKLNRDLDMIHFFTKSQAELRMEIPVLMSKIKQNGQIWISWPKKASRVVTDITDGSIRDIILPLGLVDVKVCAIDDIWSGLKLVIRKENRTLK